MAKQAKTDLTPRDRQINDAASLLLDWIKGIDPTFAANIDAAMEEHGWNARQCIGAWCAYVLENDLYIQVPTHPFFEPGFTGTGGQQVLCDVCEQPFAVAFPGQKSCGNACAVERARREELAKQPQAPIIVEPIDAQPPFVLQEA